MIHLFFEYCAALIQLRKIKRLKGTFQLNNAEICVQFFVNVRSVFDWFLGHVAFPFSKSKLENRGSKNILLMLQDISYAG